MPLEDDDQLRVDQVIEEMGADKSGTRLLVLNPSTTQKLGFWTLSCVVVNRSIGSGVFVAPAILLKATGSPGASLLLWSLGAITGICSLLVWLEFGLSIPKFELQNRNADDSFAEGESLQCVPRSGGEKNYLEYVFGPTKYSKLRTTCLYSVIYILFGNLSGNCVAFGIFVLEAAGITDGHDSTVRGLAVVCMTAACLVHAISRQGGIYTLVFMAIFKICILMAIIVIGFTALGGKTFGYGPVQGVTVTNSTTQSGPPNLDVHTSFAYAGGDFASYANSLLLVLFTFSGSEQPFYVLSEVSRPKKIFAKAMLFSVSSMIILFMLVNIAYLSVVSYDPSLSIECLSIKDSIDKFNQTLLESSLSNPDTIKNTCSLDMATVFFGAVFGPHLAPRIMSAIIAFSIFGNVTAMAFTASRVKQEIAKEGILPFSLFFARNTTTPWALLRQRLWPRYAYDPEQSPAPALLLHWIFSMILIGATSSVAADIAFQLITSLYSYTIIITIGFFTASALLYARFFCEEGEWVQRSGFKPWGGPTAAIVYTLICAFLALAAFAPPKEDSPYFTQIKWYVVPTVGLSLLVLGYLYYLGLIYVVPRFFKKGRMLVTDREAVIVREDGEYIQYLEIVDSAWEVYTDSVNIDDAETPRMTVLTK